jgi:hypothetical protein
MGIRSSGHFFVLLAWHWRLPSSAADNVALKKEAIIENQLALTNMGYNSKIIVAQARNSLSHHMTQPPTRPATQRISFQTR